jgi:NitT/TauT family transport system permease protein
MSARSEKTLNAALRNAVLSVVTFVAFVISWEVAVRAFDVPTIILPPPSAVVQAFWVSLKSGELVWHTLVTLFEILSGFALGAASGLVTGFVIALFPLAERILYPYVIAFQTIPKVAIAPIIVIWFGFGPSSKVVITATIAFFPLIASTITGLRAAPQEQVEMMITYTASRWQVFRLVRLPQALPYIFVGLDVAIVLSVIGAIVGEFVGAQAGLGYLILQRNFNMDMAGVFAILVILSLMGIGLHLLVNAVQRRVVFWMESSTDKVIGA